jgi:uroporphyrinogen decarboxylase
MNSYERVKAVLEGRVPDKVPKFDALWMETTKRWISEGYPEGVEPEDYFGYDIGGIAGILEEAKLGHRTILKESDEWVITRDGNDAELKTWKSKTGTPEHIGFGVNTREKWEELKKYLTIDEKRVGGIDNVKKQMEYQKSKGRFTVITLMEQFESAKNVLGHEEMLVNMALDPEWMEDVFKTYSDFEINMLDFLLSKGISADGIWVWGDIAYNHGPFFSPDMYKSMLGKTHKRLFDYAHSKGLHVIYHTCGRAMDMVPYLIESGIDCLHPMEAKAGMDVRQLKKQYGDKISFMGNIDAVVLSTGDKEKIEEEIRSKMTEAKKKGGYIYHSDHSIPPTVSLETYKFVMQLVDKYGMY